MVFQVVSEWWHVGGLFLLYLLAEVWHHYWSLSRVRKIDALFANAKLNREVDVVDHAPFEDFNKYWNKCSKEFKTYMREWSLGMGADLDDIVRRSKEQHISQDIAGDIDPSECVPMPILFRTYITIKIWLTKIRLESEGFKAIYLKHVHLYYYTSTGPQNEGSDSEFRKPLLVIYPQFSGEFFKLSVFSELREKFDILFVSPLGTQCSWFHKPSRHTDALEQYLPYVLRYDKVSVVTWSAGNIHFQVLDRFLDIKGLRHKIQMVIRLDPLGYPASNFLIFTHIPLPWSKLRKKFLGLCATHASHVGWGNYLASLGFSYLLKTAHGYVYVKLGRMLRATKLATAPYHEHHFWASFDPCWPTNHPVFENDREILCKNVIEHPVNGFHGLWLNWTFVRCNIFPLLTRKSVKYAS
jgi:hypothetical protein